MFCIQNETATRVWVGVTRFNMTTWTQRERWRENAGGVIYPTPCLITPKIPQDSWIAVLEMNNDINQIEGIGFIRKNLWKMRVKVFEDQNYNRYSYRSEYYKPRETMTSQQLECIRLLEQQVFTGYTHLKRGYGITKMPYKLYRRYRIQFDEFFTGICRELQVEFTTKQISSASTLKL